MKQVILGLTVTNLIRWRQMCSHHFIFARKQWRSGLRQPTSVRMSMQSYWMGSTQTQSHNVSRSERQSHLRTKEVSTLASYIHARQNRLSPANSAKTVNLFWCWPICSNPRQLDQNSWTVLTTMWCEVTFQCRSASQGKSSSYDSWNGWANNWLCKYMLINQSLNLFLWEVWLPREMIESNLIW